MWQPLLGAHATPPRSRTQNFGTKSSPRQQHSSWREPNDRRGRQTRRSRKKVTPRGARANAPTGPTRVKTNPKEGPMAPTPTTEGGWRSAGFTMVTSVAPSRLRVNASPRDLISATNAWDPIKPLRALEERGTDPRRRLAAPRQLAKETLKHQSLAPHPRASQLPDPRPSHRPNLRQRNKERRSKPATKVPRRRVRRS